MSDAPLRTTAEGPGGRVAACRIERPETHNALEPRLLEDLLVELERLDGDPDVRCIVIGGSEEVFATGAELRMRPAPAAGPPEPPTAPLWDRLAKLETPTVAAVCGWALGAGCELALACDMCVAAERSQFGLPEVTLGAIPAGGGAQRLARVLGKQRTMELVLSGRRYSAEQAHEWGLVNHVSKRQTWLGEAVDLASEIADRAPLAVRAGKRAVLAAELENLREALETERELLEQALRTEDRIEGINALAEGRRPDFQGR